MKSFDHILYEAPAEHVVRIVLNRVQTQFAGYALSTSLTMRSISPRRTTPSR